MTYLVLARKWRPRSFDTLVGQDHVVRALTHALETQRLHHAWLFTGTRGVGKTTLSRILAKSLNCEQGITAHPCGQCRACIEIDAGRYVDYVELDAASNRGVDEMTQLLEQAVYAPSSARFKVYMIDEVHMLSGHAFNAMLKTLEEPPPHVKFILATTDPQKIPVTVLSRCLQFNLKHMTVDAIVAYLQNVLAEEGQTFEVPALRLLGQAAGGSMRDALSLTDQAIAYSAGDLTLEAVQGMLGTIDQRHLVRLLQAIAAGNATDMLAVADELATRGLSYAGALADLAVLLSHIAIAQRVPGAVTDQDPLAADVQALATALHPDQVQLYYTVAVHSRNELALSPDEYAGFVMACLRMLSLTPASIPPFQPPPPPESRDAGSDKALPATVLEPPAQSGDAPASAMAASVSELPVLPKPPIEAPVVAKATAAAADDGPDIPAWEVIPDEAHVTEAKQPSQAPAQPEEATNEAIQAPAIESIDEPAGEPDADLYESDIPMSDNESAWEPIMDAVGFEDADFDTEPVALESASLIGLPQQETILTKRSPKLARMTAQDWPALAASLPLTGLAAELARQSEWVGVDGDSVTLRVAIRSLAAQQGQARLRTVLTEHFGKVVQLIIQFGSTGSDTAHAVQEARRAERQKEAEIAVANDPFVRSLIDEFGAQVIPGSIAALDDARVA